MTKKELIKRKNNLYKNPDWEDYIQSNCLDWFESLNIDNLNIIALENKLSYKEYQKIVNKNTIIKILKGQVVINEIQRR